MGLETWTFDNDEHWNRDPKRGHFTLADFKGLGTPSSKYNISDVAVMTAARLCDETVHGHLERCLYPGIFEFSPVTGEHLDSPSARIEELWLPPFGNPTIGIKGARGLLQSNMALSFADSVSVETTPPVRLPPLDAGDYQFLVKNFSVNVPSLVAIELRHGALHLFLENAQTWVYLQGDGDELSASSLNYRQWGMAYYDESSDERTVYLPTDRGLAAVSINVLALSYEISFVSCHCVGAPACLNNYLLTPTFSNDKLCLSVLAYGSSKPKVHEVNHQNLIGTGVFFEAPIIFRKKIIWMCRYGQLLVNASNSSNTEFSFIPWPENMIPKLELGRPYLSSNGTYWQQCFDNNQDCFVYLTLGKASPEIIRITSPRLSTGGLSYKLGTLIKKNPWEDPEESYDAKVGDITMPLLEFDNGNTLVIANAPLHRSIEEFFSSNEKHSTTFAIVSSARATQNFSILRAVSPWQTRFFIFRGFLYLYHHDYNDGICGWKIK